MISTLSRKHSFDAVYDSQKIFRLLLEAMANPTRVVNIKEFSDKLYGNLSEFLALAMTVLDNEVSFNTCENQSLTDEIASLTLAKREKIEAADFVFLCEPYEIGNVIEKAKCGSLSDPHKSATVIILNDGAPASRLTLYGPGINGSVTAQITQTVKDTIFLRDAQNYEYPQGIDLIFVSSSGELFAIPRLTRMELE